MSKFAMISPKKEKRKEYVDALRAIAMFFVILGHQIPGIIEYFVFTSPIKIPLFFVITGYVFNYQRKDTVSFLKNTFWKLVIPWLCLTVPFAFLKAAVRGVPALLPSLLNIISGETAWFMPCCIIAEVIWFFVNKYGKTILHITIASLLLCILGFVASRHSVLDFAMANRAMIAQYYILIGYLIKKWEEKLSKLSVLHILILSLLYVSMGFVSLWLWPNSAIHVRMNRYYNIPFCFLMITIGCLTIFRWAMFLENKPGFTFPRLLLFFGQNTLTFYLLHGYSISVFLFLLSIMHISLTGPLLVFSKVIAAYVMCSIETVIILRFFPWILGRRTIPAQ